MQSKVMTDDKKTVRFPVANRRDLIQSVAMKAGMSLRDAKHVIECYEQAVLELLNNDNSVTMKELGKLQLEIRPAREAMDFETGVRKMYPARRGVRFNIHHRFRAKLNNNKRYCK